MKKIYMMLLTVPFMLAFLPMMVTAQTTVTINAGGTAGSFNTGSVNAAGTKNDGNMVTINSSANRGWAKFDLTSIPFNAQITAVNLKFTCYSITSSTSTNNVYGFTGDPASIAGATLYTNCGSGTSFNTTTWATGLNTKALNATGIAFLQNNLASNQVCIGFVRGSTNTYNIYGYPAPAADQPQLEITYNLLTPCSAAPVSVAISSTTTTACAGTDLTITSTVNPINTPGFAYQWQSSPAGQNTWTNIPGATGTSYTTNQTSATDYQLIVTCTAASASATSNVLAIGQNPFTSCYCTPTGGNCTNEWVNGVSFNTLSNLNTGCTVGGYANYRSNPALTTSVNRGGTYSITLDDRINATNSQIGVWIDYNQNGTFDAAEFTLVGTGPATGFANLNISFTTNITIPITAQTGQTGMRVLAKNGAITASASCAAGNFGEWEDYLITINPEVPCVGAANATIATTVTTACGTTNIPLSVTAGIPPTTGLSYQWESSPAGANTWAAIPGATNTSYTATQTISTDYRFVITCTATSATGTSNVVTVTQNPIGNCYCVPTGGNCTNEWVNGVTFNTLSNLNTGCTAGGYADYKGNAALTTTVNQGGTYVITLDDRINAANSQIGVWIDYNRSGTFDAAEYTLVGTGPATGFANLNLSFSANITIPLSAQTGVTGMRVLAKNGAITNTGACAAGNFGEWEDYLITIAASVGCTGTPDAGAITGPLTRPTCGGSAPTPATAVVTGITSGVSNLTIQWETSTDNSTWVVATGTGNTSTTFTLPNHVGGQIEYYRVKVTCANSGLFDVSDVLQVTDPAAPVTQASAVGTSVLGNTSATITWTNGSGNRRFVVLSNSNSFTDPTDGTGAALVANTVYAGSGQQIVYDGTGASVAVTGLTPNTTYFARVYEYVRCGAAAPFSYYYNTATATNNPGSFTTTQYCVPVATSTSSYINNFSTTNGATNISNLASGFTPGGYQNNYATMNVTVTAGNSANFNLALVGGTVGAAIWVDFDNDFLFESTERLYNTTAYTNGPINGTIAVPAATPAGDYRMRVLIDFNSNNPTNSCGFGSGRGEAEDYKLIVTPASTDAMDWVNLQFPETATITAGGTATVYTRGYEPGVTEAPGAGAGILAWIGVSPVGAPASSNPSTWTTWIPATFNVQVGNDDEFWATFGSNLAPGTYRYASRWQLNGGPYVYGGYFSTGGGIWDGTTNVSGTLTVNPVANDECGGAITIGAVPIPGTNVNASQSQAASACPTLTSTVANDVWFQFTATSNGTAIVFVDNVASGLDPVVQAFSGSCGALAAIGCADVGANAADETLTLNGLTAGTTYYVRVYGYHTNPSGSFEISVTGGALPVTVEYFTGTKQSGQNRLDWKINCYNSATVTMVLERSADGRNYHDIANITETAVRCQSPFNKNDLSPLPGINYYRLKTIDIDGKIAYSNVVALLGSQKGFEIVSLAPNPVVDRATLSITSAEKSIMEIVVSDLNGKLLSKQRVSLVAGNNQVQLNLKNMAAGTYQVSGLTADGKLKTLRFIKE